MARLIRKRDFAFAAAARSITVYDGRCFSALTGQVLMPRIW